MIIIGAAVSYFTGMLLISCADKTDSDAYEEFALKAFGKKWSKFTSWIIVVCLLGFVVNYIVTVKTMIPNIISIITGTPKEELPYWIGDNIWGGHLLFASVFTFCVVIPMSIPRNISVLRFSSLFGFGCTLYLVTVVTLLFFTSRSIVPSMGDAFRQAEYFTVTFEGVVRKFPAIIFAYMYQPNIPPIFRELESASYSRMEKVVIRGTSGVVFLYIFVSTFGYLSVVTDPELNR